MSSSWCLHHHLHLHFKLPWNSNLTTTPPTNSAIQQILQHHHNLHLHFQPPWNSQPVFLFCCCLFTLNIINTKPMLYNSSSSSSLSADTSAHFSEACGHHTSHHHSVKTPINPSLQSCGGIVQTEKLVRYCWHRLRWGTADTGLVGRCRQRN